jgi:hypothetical protein
MEPKNYSEEDASGLRAMGFKEEQINKLFSLTDKEFRRLIPNITKKAKKQKGEYIISYITKCQLCGGEHMHQSVASCYKDWTSFHAFYRTGKGVCKVETCAKCRKYLEKLPQHKLIDMILRQKPYMSPYKFPQIIYTEDKEFRNYPLVALNYCSYNERNLLTEIGS